MQHNIVRFNSAWKSCLISNKNGMKTTIVMLHLTSKKLREDWERQHPADVKKRVSGPMECLHPDFLWVFLAHTLQMSALDIENWIKTTYSTISDNRTYGFQRRTIWCCWTNCLVSIWMLNDERMEWLILIGPRIVGKLLIKWMWRNFFFVCFDYNWN